MDALLYVDPKALAVHTKNVVLADGNAYPIEIRAVDTATWTRWRTRLITANEQEDVDKRADMLLDAQAFIVSESVVGLNGQPATIPFEKAREIHSKVIDGFVKAINEVHDLPKVAEAGKG